MVAAGEIGRIFGPQIAVDAIGLAVGANHGEDLRVGERGREIEEDVDVVGGEIGGADLKAAVLLEAGGDGVEAVDGGEGFEAIDVDHLFEVFEDGRTGCAVAEGADGDVVRAFGEVGGIYRLLVDAVPVDRGVAGRFLREEILEAVGDGSGVGEIRLSVAVGVETVVDHIDHAVKVAGADHVGLGSDFDGATMPFGMEDASKLPKITDALLKKGYGDADIEKILGGNILRVMEQVERVAAQR